MCFERRYPLGRVVIVDSQVEIVAPAYEPVLSLDEGDASDWDFCNFECLD